MDLKNFAFPEMNELQMVFSTARTIPELLEEAKERGFYNGNTKYNKMFSQLFFNGGKINIKKDIDKDFKNKALKYLKAFMGSFEPQHEEKEAVSALILSEICE